MDFAVATMPYTEGTLVLDLRDPSTRSLVWRAIASEEKNDAVKIEGKLDDMVRKSVERYPPKKVARWMPEEDKLKHVPH
jgi:uncharacterized protein DUF4136